MGISLMIISLSSNVIISIFAYLALGLSLSSWALTLSQSQSLTSIDFQGRLQSLVNAVSGGVVLTIYILITFKGDLINISTMYLIASITSLFLFLIGLAVATRMVTAHGKEIS